MYPGPTDGTNIIEFVFANFLSRFQFFIVEPYVNPLAAKYV